jgi:hypothetical protein
VAVAEMAMRPLVDNALFGHPVKLILDARTKPIEGNATPEILLDRSRDSPHPGHAGN